MNAIVVHSYFQLRIGCAKISRKYIFKTPNKCDQPIFVYKKDNVLSAFWSRRISNHTNHASCVLVSNLQIYISAYYMYMYIEHAHWKMAGV